MTDEDRNGDDEDRGPGMFGVILESLPTTDHPAVDLAIVGGVLAIGGAVWMVRRRRGKRDAR